MIRRRFPAAILAGGLAVLLLAGAAACGHRAAVPDSTAQTAEAPCGDHAAFERQTVEVDVFAYPAEALDPPWLDDRRSDQLSTAGDLGVFCAFRFVDRVEESGITFRHRPVDDAARTYKAVHYDHGNGLAVADVDGDGLHDIYFVNQVGANQLWRNLGGGRFEDVTLDAGVAVDDRVSVSASFADVDNDGDPDLYVTAIRSGNLLFENDGAGRFRDITARSGTGYAGHSSAAVFFDYDGDGLLDLYVSNVGRYTSEQLRPMTLEAPGSAYESGRYEFYDGLEDAFEGHLYPDRSESNVLYRNLGGGRFADVTEQAGLADSPWSGDASPLDVNGDGRQDLYVLNMQGHDLLYENVGGRFVLREDVFPRTPWGAMGVKAFDYDNDGDADLFVTDMHSDMSEDIGPEREKLKASIGWPEAFLLSGGRSIYGNAFYENLGERLLPRDLRRTGRRDLLAVGPQRGRPQRGRLPGRVRYRQHELPLPLCRKLSAAQQPRRGLPGQRVHPGRGAKAGRQDGRAGFRDRLRRRGPLSPRLPGGRSHRQDNRVGSHRLPLVRSIRPGRRRRP